MVEAITLYPFIFFRGSKDDYIDDSYFNKFSSVIRHELEHVYQVRTCGFITFYLTYPLFFLINLLRFRSWDDSYMSIPYEIEARKVENKELTEVQIEELDL